MEAIANNRFGEMHSLLIVKDGHLVFEEYFPGYMFYGEYTDFGIDTLHNLASVTKSITSLLFGIAIEKGLVPSVEEPFIGYFEDYPDKDRADKGSITMKHLLTMSAGLSWDEQRLPYTNPRNDMVRFYRSKDPIGFALTSKSRYEPGTRFNYNGANVNILGEIIGRTSGVRLDEFADTYLFTPLGIRQSKWIYLGNDVVYASGDLKLRPRDMAKIGWLVIENGLRQGTRIVSEGWLKDSAEWTWNFTESYGYGYLWWLHKVSVPGYAEPIRIILADGWGGQTIICIPDYNCVVVTTAGNYSKGYPLYDLLTEFILPALAE
jgi:CubicO group peptidase (beta-lactamase class C family)